MLLIAAILKVAVPVELGDTVPAADVAQMVEALLEVGVFVFQSFESVCCSSEQQTRRYNHLMKGNRMATMSKMPQIIASNKYVVKQLVRFTE